MIEVEAKAKIKNEKEFKRMAARIGKFISVENKIDDYYTLERSKYPKKSLRIRKRKGWNEINFKRKISYVEGVHAKNETEFKIGDVNGFIELLKDFGYRKWLRKEKRSFIYEINSRFHIEINFVRGLGWFLEVEYLCDGKNGIGHARKEVLRVMDKFGMKRSKVIKSGYTKLLWDKDH